MNYTHLTIEERCCLREYYKKGYSYRKIAKLIGRNVSTVSRELNRNFTHMYDIPTYYPYTAQNKYLLRRSFCHMADIKLVSLTVDDREQFITDNQEAFNYGALEEFGMRDNHFEED